MSLPSQKTKCYEAFKQCEFERVACTGRISSYATLSLSGSRLPNPFLSSIIVSFTSFRLP